MSSNEVHRSRDRRKRDSFARRFVLLVKEFGSRYRLARASGVSESRLQQYAQQELPPRADILFKLAHAANASVEWLATGKGEMRPAGLLPGVAFADVVMVELRDIHAALQMEQIRAFLPFQSRVARASARRQRAKRAHAARSGPESAAGNQNAGFAIGGPVRRQEAAARRGSLCFFCCYRTCREAGRSWSQAGLRGYRAGDLGRARTDGDRSIAGRQSYFSRGESLTSAA